MRAHLDVRAHFDLTPWGCVKCSISRADLLKTAAYGALVARKQESTWERTDKAQVLADELTATRAA